MVKRLVNAMPSKWEPEKYHDQFREKIMKYIKTKIKIGKTISFEEEGIPISSNVVDFIKLLKKSIQEKEKNKEPQQKEKRSLKKQVQTIGNFCFECKKIPSKIRFLANF
ncbi:hypothetical protein [Coxiella-like endosymbiont]|uniref:hypothetical protein n=1 Tax=Coxiella-like endosymbiont TaxID=1592897 RepID=UPI00272D4E50|nr:hypothetical protein [Coxiella-like endosymbiont]